MQPIDLTAAVEAAQQLLQKPQDALIESAILKQLEVTCAKRRDMLEADAIQMAEDLLKKEGQTSGDFIYKGYKFCLNRSEVLDFMGRPQRYTMQEGVDYRINKILQDELISNSKKYTKEMAHIVEMFKLDHPDWTPDQVKKSLSFKS